jgi:hypothetical protein
VGYIPDLEDAVTETQAILKAETRARQTGKVFFVVYECAEEGYQVADEYDLDTWFAGISDNGIRYCTADH